MSYVFIWLAANAALTYAITQRVQDGTEMAMMFLLIWLAQLAVFIMVGNFCNRLLAARTAKHAEFVHAMLAEGQKRQDALEELRKETLELQHRAAKALTSYQD
jgi:uncharacterized membrane protein